MRQPALFLLCAVAIIALDACSDAGECVEGTIPITAMSADGPPPALPSEFEFTVSEMRLAIEGQWHDATLGLEVQLVVPDGASIRYYIAAPGTFCGNSFVEMPLTAHVDGTPTAMEMDGYFATTWRDTLDRGSVGLMVEPDGFCDLVYREPTSTGGATLSGSCLRVDGLTSVNLQRAP